MSENNKNVLLSNFESFKEIFSDRKAKKRQLFKSFILDNFSHANINILDIGGGKFPLFSQEEIPEGWTYTVNDISSHELAQLPEGYHTLHADICGDLSTHHDQFDLMFSCMLAEHIEDAEAFYRNQIALLRPGGAAIHLHPTLYSIPFAINHILPHSLGKKIVETLKPDRKTKKSVFPAFYSWCTARSREIGRRKALGFSDVDVAVNYNHSYLSRIPILSQASDGLCQLFKATDTRTMASFCVYLAIKEDS